ncbi:MAG: aspartate ammonia-lyase [Acidobacteriota bacterium]
MRFRDAGVDGADCRIERDSLGEARVPRSAYYGSQTQRAIENFQLTGVSLESFPTFIRALAMVKKAAALANRQLGHLPAPTADAIAAACDDIAADRLHEHFVVDMLQGGAGTSTNMNANEVIANRALEILGRPRGDYAHCHPNDHVNMSQSTNDVIPTAIKVAALYGVRDLREALGRLCEAFAAKGREFSDVLKIGRTEMQDAVPMTLGQEFEAYAVMIRESRDALQRAEFLLQEISMGATAVGTGLNTDPRYAGLVCKHLSSLTGFPLVTAVNLVEATQDSGDFAEVSGILKRIAIQLSKIAHDLRLLSSGPRAGFAEIALPALQPGSSIMPGKVNPVIPEAISQVAYQVIGNDVAVSMAAEASQLELNPFEPLIAYNLFMSIGMLKAAAETFRTRCIEGITANRDRCQVLVERSVTLVTALVPYIGYEAAGDVAKEALATGKHVRQIVLDRGLLSEERLGEILDPAKMTHPRAILP